MVYSTPPPPRVLVVDDAAGVRHLVVAALEREGFVVEASADGRDAVARARTFQPDVIVLDIELPVVDGLEVCRQVRTFSDAYVVMLTGRDGEVDKVVGLSVGADDYMTKPFSTRELVARIRAMLRRPRPASMAAARREIGDLVIDVAARVVTLSGRPVELTKIEFDLLATLSGRPNVVFSRRQLIEAVWGDDWSADDHVIDVHISNLRNKLGDGRRAPRYITTVRGVGFRLQTG